MNDPKKQADQQPDQPAEVSVPIPEVTIRGTGVFTPPLPAQPESPSETDTEPDPDDSAGQ